jgi:hypothetical protein
VGREQRPAAVGVVQGLGAGPGDGQAVIGGGAAADLVEDHQRARACLGEDGGGLDHLHHEGRAAAGQVVARADAAEQAVDDAEPQALGGHEAAGLGQDGQQGVLAQEGRLAGHVRAGDDRQPRPASPDASRRQSLGV